MKAPIPDATIARLPIYLRCLSDLGSVDESCSSDELATAAGVKSAQVRKDFSYLGRYGTRGVGYDVADLTAQLRKVLGLTRPHPLMIVGAGTSGLPLRTTKESTRGGSMLRRLSTSMRRGLDNPSTVLLWNLSTTLQR